MVAQHISQPPLQNHLLSQVGGEDLDALRPWLNQVSLSYGQTVIVPNEPIRDVYFPLNSLLCLITITEDGSMIESGTIGREGMAGLPVLLDADETPTETIVQIPGEAIQLEAKVLKEVFDRSSNLQRLLHRYIHTVIVAGSQSTACNQLHQLDARLSRWLLMSSDGIGSDTLNLTQEFLSTMLGVRRAGVTNAAIKLQEAGLIRYNRGTIQILDRAGLEASACECYQVISNEYDRLLG